MTEQKVLVKNLEINYKVFEEAGFVRNNVLLILKSYIDMLS